MERRRIVPLLAAWLLLSHTAAVWGAPWVRQDRWLLLGPIHSSGDCWGELGMERDDYQPVAGHNAAAEAPAAGEDWGDGGAPFVQGAPTHWLDLAANGALPSDVVDLQALAEQRGLGSDRVFALATVYVENLWPAPFPIDVCTASDDSIIVWVNDDRAARVSACRGVATDCAETNPAVLVPGKNKITVAVYDGAGGWGFRLGLNGPDGTRIDDENDSLFRFSTDPAGYLPTPFSVLRAATSLEGGDGTSIVLRGNGRGAAGDLITVVERITGEASASEISKGGLFQILAPNEGQIVWRLSRAQVNAGLSYRLLGPPGEVRLSGTDDSGPIAGPRSVFLSPSDTGPVGPHFTHAHDIGNARGGSAAFDPSTGLYTQVSSGDDVWDSGDSFHFAYRNHLGDIVIEIEIVERVDPSVPESRWGKHGIMARQDLSPRSRHTMVTTTTGQVRDWPRLTSRLLHDTSVASVDQQQANYADVDQRPRFQRLVRHGSTFYGYVSRDGAAWELLGTETWHGLDATTPVLFGFAATSHSSALGNPSTLRYRVLRVETPSVPAPHAEVGINQETSVERFDVLDAARWQVNVRSGAHAPRIVGGKLRLLDGLSNDSAVSVFSREPIEDIDAAACDFEFTAALRLQPGKKPADGITFTVASGGSSHTLTAPRL